jgi:apolipoprotein N-acyltransferase
MAIWLVCVSLSAAGFYLSIGLGEIWPLAWLAPIPVLWLAMRSARIRPVIGVAFSAYALGGLNLLPAYLGVLPPFVLVLAVCGPALLFALAVAGARLAHQSFGWGVGALAFAALWAGFDFLLAFDPAGGSALTPAASQVAMPMLVQAASVTGFSGVTFIMGAFAATMAAAARHRSVGAALLGLALCAANAGYGVWRMSAPLSESMRVALIAGDDAVGKVWDADQATAQGVVQAYAKEIQHLQGRGVQLIVLPENLMRMDPAWREQVLSPLAQAARALDADIVMGFNTKLDGAAHNVAWVARGAGETAYYSKRQLVPGLETTIYERGDGPLSLSGGVMVAICKDLDFPAMIRADVAGTSPALIAVPAWDFDRDGWSHARVAILRGVENGVAIARTARSGVLTLSDRYGRVVARERSTGPVRIVVGDLPVSETASPTLYNRVGDLFGWLFIALAIAITAASAVAAQRKCSTRGHLRELA